jgi:hypothetical protein
VAVKFVKPNANLVAAIARDMRQADVDEVWLAARHTPIEALTDGWDRSNRSVVVTVDDQPCVMIGLVIRDTLSGIGIPWLLGTDAALKHRREFINSVKPVMDEMLSECWMLYNWVHSENRESIRWLKRIGFTVEDPQPYGFDNAMFHKFHIER